MVNQFEFFASLHHQAAPLLIGNVWNAQSARTFQKKKFKAIATSSAAVAETLGYSDGEQMSFDEYFFVIQRIVSAVSTPLSVDLENGYGSSAESVVERLVKLYDIGVSGINIEDSVVANGKRTMLEATSFAKKLSEITELMNRRNITLFINVRIDAFLLGLPNAVDEALSRTTLYEQTGAHGLFFPGISTVNDIEKITAHSKLPVNVMCVPGLPDFDALQQIGVKRISMGNYLNKKVYQTLESSIDQIASQGSFQSVF
jgi:2-methylisocitrate lyase-like PEP mutase family enzyme